MGYSDCITFLFLSSDGPILASAPDDETIRFWDAASGIPIGQPFVSPLLVNSWHRQDRTERNVWRVPTKVRPFMFALCTI